jgi:glycosyltransferase involved in cell wall biosynthesis
MIRPSSPRRGARETMEVLAELDHRFGERVEIHLFGVEAADPLFELLPREFRWRLPGVLTRAQTAQLLATQDILLELSRFQAMGLMALEAMACGLGVVVPREGGAVSFAVDRQNALVVDTSNASETIAAAASLIEDAELLARLRRRAACDAVKYPPERAAFEMLDALLAPA